MPIRSRFGTCVLAPLVGGLALATAPALMPLAPGAPLRAAEIVPARAVRAINLARTHVVRLNGGLSAYRPAQCMFATAASTNPCLVRNDADGYLFHFVGGSPAWEQQNRMPTVETEILISPEGREVGEVVYNGELRAPALAISLARTHAVELNGGPTVYEPDSCMLAPAAARGNRCLVSQNSSGYRFRFRGGAPNWQRDMLRATRETEILISPDGRTVEDVIYNGDRR